MNRDPELKAWVKSQWTAASRLMGDTVDTLSGSAIERLEKTFNELADQWRKEAGMLSVVQQKAIHPAYQRIIGMGKPALPLIFKELQKRREHWLWALKSITGEDAAKSSNNFNEAVSSWLKWGGEKGYL